MLRRLLILFVAAAGLFATSRAHAANCPLASGGNIQSAVNSCGSGNTVTLAAGNYTVSSTVNLPCGVSIMGPVPTSNTGTQPHYSQTHNQTAIITSTMGIDNWGFTIPSGCSVAQTIQYVEWNGGDPTNGTVFITTDNESPAGAVAGNLNPAGGNSCRLQHGNGGGSSYTGPANATSDGGEVSCGNGGGNFVYISSNATQPISILNNYIHGNNCGFLCGDTHAGLIYINNNGTTPANNNVTIAWNIFNAPGDCAQAIVWSYNQNTEGGGGSCNGVEMGGYLTNIYVQNNIFLTGDDELKVYEMYDASGPGECNNCVFQYNDFQKYDRIAYEGQANWGGPSSPTLMYLQYNSFHNMLVPKQQDYDISMANGCEYGFNTSGEIDCVNHMDYNVSVQDTNGTIGIVDAGYEYWGGNGSTANGNFWSGNYLGISIQWDPSGNYTFANNTVMSPALAGNGGTNGTCGLLYANINGSPYTNPTCTGNFNQTSTGTITSVAPVLSVSGSTITIMNTTVSTPNGSNPGRDSNTTFWCTTDGSTPVPGSGTAVPFWVGAASQTVGTISGNVKCVGMWGAPNQAYSYVPVSSGGGGYVPSAVVSASTGSSTVATPTFSPSGESFSGSVTVTASSTTSGATLHCTTDGSTPTTSSPTYTGPQTFTATTTFQCMGALTGDTNSAVGGATYTLSGSPTAATPTFSPGAESFSVSASVTISDSTPSSTIYYTTNGTTPTTSSAVYTGAITVTTTETIKAIATASGYLNSAVGSAAYTLVSPTLSAVTISLPGGGTTMALGGSPEQACVNMTYVSPSESTQVCGSGTDAYGSSPGGSWTSLGTGLITSTSSGVLTAVAVGSATIEATVGSFTPTLSVTVTSTPPTFASVSVSLSGGGTALNTGTTGQACANFLYTSPTTTTQVCGSGTDAYGMAVSTFLSSTTGVATITTPAGVITPVAPGTTALTASVTGANVVSGVASENNIASSSQNTYEADYVIVGANGLSPQTASIYVGSGTSGGKIDLGITQATSPTTQASTPLCYGTITESGLTNQLLTATLSGCPALAPGAAVFIWMNTNDPTLNVGKHTCTLMGGCTGTPTSANYGDCAASVTYGTYTGFPTSFSSCPGDVQRTQYFTSLPVSPAFTLNVTTPVVPSYLMIQNAILNNAQVSP